MSPIGEGAERAKAFDEASVRARGYTMPIGPRRRGTRTSFNESGATRAWDKTPDRSAV